MQRKNSVVTPEPRELAECGLPRSQHLRVSEGPPLAPQSWSNIMGAILLLRAGPGRQRPRRGVGTAFGTGPALSLLHRDKQECISKSYWGKPGVRLLVSYPNLKPCFKKAKMCVWGSRLFASWIFYGVIRLKSKPHSRQTYALYLLNSIFTLLGGWGKNGKPGRKGPQPALGTWSALG